MKLLNMSDNSVNLTMTFDELAFLCNAINEAVAAVPDWEFHARTGATSQFANSLQVSLMNVLDAHGDQRDHK